MGSTLIADLGFTVDIALASVLKMIAGELGEFYQPVAHCASAEVGDTCGSYLYPDRVFRLDVRVFLVV